MRVIVNVNGARCTFPCDQIGRRGNNALRWTSSTSTQSSSVIFVSMAGPPKASRSSSQVAARTCDEDQLLRRINSVRTKDQPPSHSVAREATLGPGQSGRRASSTASPRKSVTGINLKAVPKPGYGLGTGSDTRSQS